MDKLLAHNRFPRTQNSTPVKIIDQDQFVFRRLLVIFIVSVIFSACGSISRSPLIAVVMPDNEYSSAIKDGMRSAASQQGARIWFSQPTRSIKDEAAKIRQALRKDPVALIIFPMSLDGSLSSIQMAIDSGKPVICFEACPAGLNEAIHIVPGPNRDAGNLIGNLALSSLSEINQQNTGVLILQCAQDPGCSLRSVEFTKQLKQIEGITAIYSTPGPGQPEVGQMLKENPSIRLVWATGQPETLIAIQAVEEINKDGQISVFGFGLDEKTSGNLSPGKGLTAAAVPLPYQSGFDAVFIASRIAAGETVPDPLRKSAMIITEFDQQAQEYIASDGKYSLPTPVVLPETGTGIKPSCNCGPTASPTESTNN